MQHATVTEEPRLVGVVGHGTGEIELPEAFEVVGEYLPRPRSVTVCRLLIHVAPDVLVVSHSAAIRG